MNSGSWAATNRDAASATASTSALRCSGESAMSCGIAARSPPRASAAIVGLSSGTWSLARQCSDSSTGRKPQSASNGVSASSSSGLWNGSLNVRVGVVPRDAGRLLGGEPGRGLLVGRVGLEGQRLLRGQHLHQEGQPGPEARDRPRPPSSASGSPAMALSSGVPVGEHAGLVRVRAHPQLRVRRSAGTG